MDIELRTMVENEMEPVILLVYLRSGSCMSLKMTAKIARETLKEWKKTWMQSTLSKEEQSKIPQSERGLFLYHVMEGDPKRPETMNVFGSFCIYEVVAMNYIPMDNKCENHQIKMAESFKEFVDLMKEEIKKGEDWKGEN